MMVRLLTLVVPCHNEVERLQPDAFVDFVDRHREVGLVMVDDGSHDGTATVLAAIRAQAQDRVEVVSVRGHVGKGEAVRRGLLHAREIRSLYVGYWDADLAAPLDESLGLVSVLEANPAAVAALGVRVPGVGRRIERTPFRRVAGRVYARLGALAAGAPLVDSQCGAKVFRAIDEVWACLVDPFTVRWAFDVELLTRLAQETRTGVGEEMLEVPLNAWREVPKSRMRPHDRFGAVAEMARLILRRFRV